ncbi:MAG: cell division protein FtsA [Pseudomonadota bacterium]
MTRAMPSTIAVLDVGTSKLCCFIARGDDGGEIHIEGIGHHVSAGIKAGTVTDMAAAESAIRHVVHQAEAMASRTIEDVMVVTTAGDLASALLTVEVSVAGHAVARADIDRVLRLAGRQVARELRAVLHAQPACYSVDGAFGVRDPEGMFGERLGVDFHMVTAEAGPLQNLETCIQRCHLNVAGFIAAPYAAGLATLHEEEKDLGVACIDMGGGVTSIAIFCGGQLVDCAVLPLGGAAITRDIAKLLSTPLAEAERLKTLYGTVLECAADHREVVEVTPLAEPSSPASGGRIRKSQLTGLIRPRVEETLELAADKLRAAGFLGRETGTVVLTGGASSLSGINHLAEEILRCPVRFGFPLGPMGLAEATSGPAFAAGVGALLHAAQPASVEDYVGTHGQDHGRPWPERIVQWLREAL